MLRRDAPVIKYSSTRILRRILSISRGTSKPVYEFVVHCQLTHVKTTHYRVTWNGRQVFNSPEAYRVAQYISEKAVDPDIERYIDLKPSMKAKLLRSQVIATFTKNCWVQHIEK